MSRKCTFKDSDGNSCTHWGISPEFICSKHQKLTWQQNPSSTILLPETKKVQHLKERQSNIDDSKVYLIDKEKNLTDSHHTHTEQCFEGFANANVKINSRVKVLWNNGRWYAGTIVSWRTCIIANIQYDDGEINTAKLNKCQLYQGMIPQQGLYFTEGDLVTIKSDFGVEYDQEGVVIALETWKEKSYRSLNHTGKSMSGPFGIFTVRLTKGDNIGYEIEGIRSENLRRRGQYKNTKTVSITEGFEEIIYDNGAKDSDDDLPLATVVIPISSDTYVPQAALAVTVAKTKNTLAEAIAMSLKKDKKEKDESNTDDDMAMALAMSMSKAPASPSSNCESNFDEKIAKQVNKLQLIVDAKRGNVIPPAMVSTSLLPSAIALVTQAIQFDHNKRYVEAHEFYVKSMDHFLIYIRKCVWKYKDTNGNAVTKKMCLEKMKTYCSRIDKLHQFIVKDNNQKELIQLKTKLRQATEAAKAEKNSLRAEAKKRKKEQQKKLNLVQKQLLRAEAKLKNQKNHIRSNTESFVWECKTEEGWTQYNQMQQMQLETALQNNDDTIALEFQNGSAKKTYKYEIDLRRNVQTNIETKNCRMIQRRVLASIPNQKTYIIWECQTENGWIQYNQMQQMQLETALQNNDNTIALEFQNGSANKTYKYEIDLNQNVQINLETKVERNIRRISKHVTNKSEVPWQKQGKIIRNGVVRYKIDAESVSNGRVSRELTEFQKATAQFYHHMKSQSQVTMVEVYENKTLEMKYLNKQQTFINNGHTNEVWVFHGTSTSNIKNIMCDGFKVGGKEVPIATGNVYGTGIYSATAPTDPVGYNGGSKKLILSKALTGSTGSDIKGKDGSDSWTPNRDWRIFKTGEQLLPRYVIHFK